MQNHRLNRDQLTTDLLLRDPSMLVIEPLNARPEPSIPPNATLTVPENTEDVSVASVIKVNLLVESL